MCAFGIWTTLCRFSADIKDQQQQQRKQNKKYTQSEMHLHWNEFHCNGFPPEFFHFCFYAILCSKSGSVSVSVKWKKELFTEWLSFFLQCFNDVKTLKESLFSVKVHNTAAMHLYIYPIWIQLNLLQHIFHSHPSINNELWGAKDCIIKHTLFAYAYSKEKSVRFGWRNFPFSKKKRKKDFAVKNAIWCHSNGSFTRPKRLFIFIICHLNSRFIKLKEHNFC